MKTHQKKRPVRPLRVLDRAALTLVAGGELDVALDIKSNVDEPFTRRR